MKHATIGQSFKIIHDKRISRGTVQAHAYIPWEPCRCGEEPCECPEIRVFKTVRINAHKRTFVWALGREIGYSVARRLWANAKLHTESVCG